MSFRNQTRRWNRQMLSWISPKQLALLLLGTAILSFGMHNIHRRVGITEGGVLGMVLWECPLFSGYGSSLRQCCRIFRHIRWQRLCWAAFLWESV